MRTLVNRTPPVADLPAVLAGARRRWRLRHVALGAAIVVAALGVTIWLAALGMERYRFTPTSVLWGRMALGFVTAVVGVRWILYPLLRRISDDRFALYLEERVPALDGAVISAVEVRQRPAPEGVRSPMLERGLVADAVRRLQSAVEVTHLERSHTLRGLVLTLCALAGLAGVLLLGPTYVRQGARLIFTPWRNPAAAPVYQVTIEPGDLTVPRGADVQVDAHLAGFTSDLVELVVRRGATGEWERIAMGPGPGADASAYRLRLFDVSQDAEYFVEASGVRSDVARLTVRDLPAVNGVKVSLRYPAYTGLPAEQLEGGDIAAVAGTRATVRVHATRAVRGGRLVLDDGRTKIDLAPVDDTTLATTIVVNHDGFYRIELDDRDGTRVPGTVEYVVDALEDGAPAVTITKPGRDTRPSPVDEVRIEAQATDDFGVGRMELVYRVNGGEEKVVALTEGSARTAREVTAGHTLFLEELSLQPGDVIAYYARAWDNSPPRRRPGSAAPESNRAASDIYFLTVRPFSRDFRQNQQGGGGGGGQQEMNPGALVATQKEIISATFKAQRDSASTQARTLREDAATIHLSQGRLRERVEGLIERLQRPAVQAADSGFRKLAEIMPKARDEMRAAEERLAAVELTNAQSPEQRALQWLERAEAVFREVQVSQQQGGGGGGGGQEANASDLADLLELENDKLRNQYEQVQRSQEQQSQQQVDETLERLKRLAARQQQENARQRQGGSRAQGGGGGGGGGSQRQLADETEQLARQLERLAREQRSNEMQETARRLQDAANQMRRSAAQGSGTGASASEQLDRARRLLEESQQRQSAGGAQDAARRAQSLAEQQRDVARDVAQMGQGQSTAERDARVDERKQAMANEVTALERDLERMARDPQAQQSGAASAMREAAGGIRRNRLDDRIKFSRESMRAPSRDYANNVERQIQTDLDSLASRLSRVAGRAVAGADSAQRTSRTLAQARDLVRGLASIDDRMRERRAGQQAGGQGGGGAEQAQGQGGQQRQGQQGQGAQGQGQQGQGQQGRGQQGQGQQGQGQQGQGQQGQGQQGQGQQGQGQGQQQGGQGGGRGTPQQGQAGGRGGMPNEPGQRQPGGQFGGQGQGGPPMGLSAEDVRQFSRELRAQREAAEGLRRDLAGSGMSTADLDRLIQRLRQLESGRTFNDPEELTRLQGAVIEGFKEFEFGLRRQLGARDRDGPVLGGSDDVPAAYRDMVSEYFRALSRKGRSP